MFDPTRFARREYARRFKMGESPDSIALDQGIERKSVLRTLNRAGIRLAPTPRPWTALEDEKLLSMRAEKHICAEIARVLGRSCISVYTRLHKLRYAHA